MKRSVHAVIDDADAEQECKGESDVMWAEGQGTRVSDASKVKEKRESSKWWQVIVSTSLPTTQTTVDDRGRRCSRHYEDYSVTALQKLTRLRALASEVP
jgi:hypothetical protein